MPDLSLLLDDAIAEAKRRGHGIVLPAHLAVVTAARYPDVRAAWASSVLPSAETALAPLPVTYDRPTVDASTAALEPALRAGDLAAVTTAIAQALPPPTVDAATGTDPSPAVAIPAAHQRWASLVPPDDTVIGRGEVVDAILDALDRRVPAPVLVVGDEGSGRTSLAAALAASLSPRGTSVVRIDNAACPADQRLAALSEMIRLAVRDEVLFIDDLEIALGLGYPSGVDGQYLSVLRPAMENPHQRIVAVVATPYLARLQGAERELADEFTLVELPLLPADLMRQVVRGEADALESFHHVTIPDPVVDAALAPPHDGELGTHPALAIRRLDVAATRASRAERDAEWVREVTATVTVEDLPIARPVERRVQPGDLAPALRAHIVGQEPAIEAVAARLAITVAQLDLNPHRPDGVFLFAGPTGVGKTALALALAQELFGSDEAVVRIDMSELHDEHTVAKLVGAPPGYIGYDNPDGWLTSQIRRTPRCVLLLDEIEKADPQVWNTFLQVFDAGRLTDFRGMTADFREVVIVMTTNLGAEVFSSTGSVGFVEAATSASADASTVREILRRTMRPELLNRIDEILVFSPLTTEAVREIARARTEDAVERLRSRGYALTITPELYAVIERVGFSKEYGAREVLRTVERLVLQPLAAQPPGAYRAVIDGDSVTWEGA